MCGIEQWRDRVIHGDCLAVMKKLPDRSIDMVLCDLPYGTTVNKWDQNIDLGLLWEQYNRVVKKNGAIVLTAQGVFTAQLISSNLARFKYKLVWVKSKATNFLNANRQPLRKHEDVCVFYDGQPVYHPQMSEGAPYDRGKPKNRQTESYGTFNPVHIRSDGSRYPTDVCYFKTAESESTTFHSTQKPVELGRWLVRTFTNPGDTVLDNACGSGSFLVAAALEKRHFIGIELNRRISYKKEKEIDLIKVCESRTRSALQTIK